MSSLRDAMQEAVNDPTTKAGWDTEIAFTLCDKQEKVQKGKNLFVYTLAVGEREDGTQRAFLSFRSEAGLSAEEKLHLILDSDTFSQDIKDVLQKLHDILN